MAIKMSASSKLVFFQQFFASEPQIFANIQKLVTLGVDLSTDFYTVHATITATGEKYQAVMSANTSALMKGSTDAGTSSHCRNKIMGLLAKAWAIVSPTGDNPFHSPAISDGSPEPVADTADSGMVPIGSWTVALNAKGPNQIETIKLIRAIFNLGLKEAKQLCDLSPVVLCTGVSTTVAQVVEMAFKGIAPVVCYIGVSKDTSAAPFETKPVNWKTYKDTLTQAVNPASYNPFTASNPPKSTKVPPVSPNASSGKVALKDAVSLGQRVYGSSPDSTYNVIAIGERIKVAAKITKKEGYGISLRVEGHPYQEELSKLNSIKGFSWKPSSGYGSLHLTPGDVPASRIIGAFLMGLEIPFQQRVVDAGELVIDGK